MLDQNIENVEYKGYEIRPKPIGDGETDALWFGGYDILKGGQMVSSRSRIFPAFPYHKAACIDSIEHAKIEIDNLISVQNGSAEPGAAG